MLAPAPRTDTKPTPSAAASGPAPLSFASFEVPAARALPARVLVVGLGNPILGDDGVGWHVADAVQRRLDAAAAGTVAEVEVDCAALGGLALMERMVGYDRVIVVDSIETNDAAEGDVRLLKLEELPDLSAGHTASAHDVSLRAALDLGRAAGALVPPRVDVIAIEAHNMYRFSDTLSMPLLRAIPRAVAAVFDLLAKEDT